MKRKKESLQIIFFLPICFFTLLYVAKNSVIAASRAGSQHNAEVFLKGSFSKNNISEEDYTVNLTFTGGFGISLLPQLRIEARYANTISLQNRMVISRQNGDLYINDFKVTTSVYSAGLDLDLLDATYIFQPFVFVGVGYVETERSYYIRPDEAVESVYFREPKRTNISGSLGIGLRIRILRAIALEVEGFTYGLDLKSPTGQLSNMYATVGVRIFM